MCYIHALSFIVPPNMAPKNFSVVSTTSTTITFSWKALNFAEANGIVRWHMITCNDLTNSWVCKFYGSVAIVVCICMIDSIYLVYYCIQHTTNISVSLFYYTKCPDWMVSNEAILLHVQYCPEVMLQSLTSAQIQAATRHNTRLEYITCKGTWLKQLPEGVHVSWLHMVS